MGTVYRRTVRICRTCDERLDTSVARLACEGAGHSIEFGESPIWWVRYQRAGREQRVSARTTDRAVAEALLQTFEADHASTVGGIRQAQASLTVDATLGAGALARPAVTFDAAADALIAEYRLNGKRSLRTLTLRLRKHLRPAFGPLVLTAITTPLVLDFISRRHEAGASNATINRDLITLKRVLNLAVQDGTLDRKPYIPLLQEQNIRRGFFEPADLVRLQAHLPAPMRGIAAFAFLTGWRTPSEILPLEWRHVDWSATEIRLDAGTTKNGDGRVFPFTEALRRVLEEQRRVAAGLGELGLRVTHVFCYQSGRHAGQRISETAYIHAWRRARVAAGCPDRIPHDFRRTAVRNLVRAGVPERVAMQLTGHKTRAIFERYNIVSPGDLRDAAQRLDGFFAGSP